jgi:hypothetical protein
MDRFDSLILGMVAGVLLLGILAIILVPNYDMQKSEVKKYFEKPKFCSEPYLNLTVDQVRMCDIFKEVK